MRRTLTLLAASIAVMAAGPAVALAHHHHSRHHHFRHHRSHRLHHARMRHERFGRDQTLPSGEQDQQAGTVSSFTPGSTPGTGTLTIMVGNSSVTGQVTNDTRLECESSAPDTQGDEGNDDGDNGQNSGDDNSGSGDNQTVNSQDGDNGSDNSGDNDGAGEDQGDDEQMCSTSSLTPGTSVSEANLEITSAGAIWQKVELITS